MDIFKDIVTPVLQDIRDIDDLNFEISEDLALYNTKDAILDSLSLVEFLVEIQDKIFEVTGKKIILSTPELFRDDHNNFSTVSTLIAYIKKFI